MKRLISSLHFRIWFPFAFAILIGVAFMGYYYPRQQAKLFRESSEKNLDEISKILALSTSLSVDYQNFSALSNSINTATSMRGFEFVALVQKDSVSAVETIFAANPSNLDGNLIFKIDSTKYLVRKHPINTKLIKGYIVIGVSKEKLEQRIAEINKPVYIGLLSVLFISLIVFLIFAKYLSKPVVYLTAVANELTQGNYYVSIKENKSATEINDLNVALLKLQEALIEARNKNEDFNKKLEEKIKIRTKDLESTKLRLLEAQEVAELGNFEFDLINGTWDASANVYKILEVPEGFSFTNSSWAQLLGPENSEVLFQLFASSISNHASFQQDFIIHTNGNSNSEKWISISGKVFQNNSDASHQRIRGTIQNITNRKKTENEIRKLSLVAQKTSNCVIITDENYVINWINESTLKLTGYSRDEIIGNTPSMFQFEKTSEATKSFIRSKLKNLEEVKTTILNRSKSGFEYWLDLNIVPLFNEEQQHIGFIAVEVDITDRVNFEINIRESEENYRTTLENSSELIHTIDLDGKLIWANRSWKEKLGVSDENIAGFDLIDFIDKESLDKFHTLIPRLHQGEIITNLECVFVSKNGTSLNLQGRAIPYYKNNSIVGSQAYLHDITLIKKAELDLKSLLELTQNQNKRLRNFTHIVSHNLRSHSANLRGLINLLSIEWPDFKENSYFEFMESASNNLMEVIENLSEIANIQTDDQKKFIAIDIHQSVKKVIASIYGIAQSAGVEIQFDHEEVLTVTGDQAYIESILLNLLTNAIKYKSDERKPYVQIVTENDSEFICLKVIDNGLGIDLERQGHKIFGMYKTFHNHPDARGVGLFLAKNQVEAMGGKIEVESKIGEGSVFKLYLKK